MNKKLKRIQRIFKHGIPVIGVSNSLIRDIKLFSNANFKTHILPNVVDTIDFSPEKDIKREDFFFMVSNWKWPKKPLILLQAFKAFLKDHKNFRLKVGGFGPDYEKIEQWVIQNKMHGSVELLGVLDQKAIAHNMIHSRAFLHCSRYETFSVVCAEAVISHTPCIVSDVGGIPEVVSPSEGILIKSERVTEWVSAMKACLQLEFHFKNGNVFSKNAIGIKYRSILAECITDFNKP
ncbi:MAG: glycosyltransferase family 4 protein [Bacteroidota bacterium]